MTGKPVLMYRRGAAFAAIAAELGYSGKGGGAEIRNRFR
jgi:hypothetical protein